MKKRTKRLLAMLLASAMILQQGSTVGVLATESEPASETVAETTAATEAETKAPETQAPETKASETTAPETTAPETQAASETQATEAATSPTQTETSTSETTETAAKMTEKVTEAATTEATEAPAETEEKANAEDQTDEVSNTEDTFDPITLGTDTPMTIGVGMGEPVKLEDLKGTLTANLVTGGAPYKRDSYLDFTLNFTIDNDKVAQAKEASAWTYDISSVYDSIFGEVIATNGTLTGDLFEGTEKVGTYEVDPSTKTVRIVPNKDWIAKKDNNIHGSFTLRCKCDEKKIKEQVTTEFTFPGTSNKVDLTFENVTGTHEKNGGYNKGDRGDVTIAPGDQYRYEVKTTTNAVLSSLTLSDTLGDGQTLNGEIEITGPDGLSKKINVSELTVNEGNFTLDLKTIFGVSELPMGEYKVVYYVTVDGDGWNKKVTNESKWTWGGTAQTEPDKTSFVPRRDLTKKTMTPEVTETTTDDGTKTTYYSYEFDYEITVGNKNDDLSGYHLKDVIDLTNQTLDPQLITAGKLQITGPNGEIYEAQLTEEAKTKTTGEVTLFDFTFPSGAKGPCKVTYKTTSKDGLSGSLSVNNKTETKIPNDDYTEYDDSNKNVDFSVGPKEEKPSIEKSASLTTEDIKNNDIWWEIKVIVPSGVTIEDPIIKEAQFWYGELESNWYYNNLGNLEFDWTRLTVQDEAGNDIGYDITGDESTGYNIHLKQSISSNVIIKVPTKYMFDSASRKFTNTVELYDGSAKLGEKTAEITYESEYTLKKTGTYNSDDRTVTWKLEINTDKREYDGSVTAVIRDTIPEGMEYVDKSFSISSDPYYDWANHMPAVNWDSSTRELKVTLGKLSETAYYVEYTTKITDDTYWEGKKSFTNNVNLLDENGKFLGRTSDTVEVERNILTKTHGDLKDDLLTYTIDVNKDEVDLSDEDTITLTDVIPDEVSLVTETGKGAITFTPAQGCLYTYVDHVLTVVVPDSKHVRVQYTVKIKGDGEQKFTNTVELKGRVTKSASKDAEVTVLQHSGTLGGASNRIMFQKYTADLKSKLNGAEFTIYEVSYDKTSKVINKYNPAGTAVTSDNGNAEIGDLHYGVLYSWRETKAPIGYENSSAGDHYFILYDNSAMGGVADKTNVNTLVKELQTANTIKIEVSSGPVSAQVTDEEIKGVGSLTVTKNVTGNNTDTTTTFHFKVTLKDGKAAAAVNGTFDDVDFKDGVATFDLTPGSSMTASKTITGLPAGLNYTVEEFTNAGEKTGYTLTGKTGDTGTIVADNTVTATFTNTRNKTTAELKVEKTYNDTFPTAETDKFSFTLTAGSNDATNPKIDTPMPKDSADGSKTVKVTSDAAETFGAITYEEDGTYNYTITENSGSLSGVTYDTSVYHIRVKVTTDATGGKKAEISVAKAANADASVADEDYVLLKDTTIYTAMFNNTHVADGSTELSVQKVFGGAFPTGEKAFKFTLSAGTNTATDPTIDTPMPEEPNADGKTKTVSVKSGAAKSFGTITYEQDGDYFYTIKEVTTGTGLLSDVLYDTNVYYIKVSVTTETVAGEATKKATVSYGPSDKGPWQDTKQAAFTATFTNYKIQDAKAELKVKKAYNGSDWPTGEDAFKFTLTAGDNTTNPKVETPMPSKNELTVTNDTVQTFGEITFEKDGTYNYQISETKGNLEGVIYDETVYDIKITVSTNSNGTRTVKVESKKAEEDETKYSKADGIVFTAEFNNVHTETQEEASGKLELNVTKSMKNSASTKDLSKFSFMLEQTSPASTPKLKMEEIADADGNVKFELLYGESDKGKTFVYEITEQTGSDATVIYDPAVYTATVKVADKADDEGVLAVEVQSVKKKIGDTTTDLGAKGAVTFVNDETTVVIDKTDKDTGVSLTGATLQIVDSKTGAVVEGPWTTDGKAHDVTGKLEIGGSYKLAETAAPAGYTIADPVEFSVNDKGQIVVAGKVVTAITMQDTKNKVSILKIDGSGAALAGAKLVVKDKDGKTVVGPWTTDGKAHDITGIAPGTYTVSELEAPNGYEIAEDKTFTITGEEKVTDKPIEVRMTDQKTITTNRSLTVTKHLRVRGLDGYNGEIGLRDATFYVALFSDEARTHRVSSVKTIEFRDATASTVTFTNLDANKTYYVGETDADGEVLPGGLLRSDDMSFYPEYGQTAQFKFEGQTTTGAAEFTNVYVKWPDNYYLAGQLTVTKKVLLNGEEGTSNDTFYARVFKDAALTTPVDDQIMVLSMAGGSTTSATVTNLPIGSTPGSSMTYYVAETDVNGIPLDPSAVEFEISVDKSEIVLSGANPNGEVVITNSFTEEEKSEFESEFESEEESETETEAGKKTAPKTGDDTDFTKYLLLLTLSAGTCAVIFEEKRRKNHMDR